MHGIRCLQRCLLCIYCVMLEIFVTARSHVGRYTQRPFENPRLYRRRYSRRARDSCYRSLRLRVSLVYLEFSRCARGRRVYFFFSLSLPLPSTLVLFRSLSFSLFRQRERERRNATVCSFYFRCVKSGARTRTR